MSLQFPSDTWNFSSNWVIFSFQRWSLLHADLFVMSRQRDLIALDLWWSNTIGTEVMVGYWMFCPCQCYLVVSHLYYDWHLHSLLTPSLQLDGHRYSKDKSKTVKKICEMVMSWLSFVQCDSVWLLLLLLLHTFRWSCHQHSPILMLDHWTPHCWSVTELAGTVVMFSVCVSTYCQLSCGVSF